MLTKVLRELLLNLVHIALFLVLFVKNVWQRIRINEDYVNEKNTGDEIKIIIEKIPRNNNKLRHLVVIADTNSHTLTALAKVVIWSLVAGVPFISFYDISGLLEKQEDKLFIEVEKNKKGIPGCIKWSHRQDLNGYTNGGHSHTIVVNILKLGHGRDTITKCIKEMSDNKITCPQSPEQLTVQQMDQAISFVYSSIISVPDPDLVLYTGALCSTRGLLPWHIRLTEFVQISSNSSLNVHNYVNALNKFNKCDQRFGK